MKSKCTKSILILGIGLLASLQPAKAAANHVIAVAATQKLAVEQSNDPLNLLKLTKWTAPQVIAYVQAVLQGNYSGYFEDHLDLVTKMGWPDLAKYLEAFANGYKATCLPLAAYAAKLLANHPISNKLIAKLTGMLMAIKGQDHIWQAVLAVRRPTTETTVTTVIAEQDTDIIDQDKHKQVHTKVQVEQTVTSRPLKKE